MNRAYFQFFGDLDDFLTAAHRGKAIEYPFVGNPSIKHMIQALRVPHTEVGEMFVNGAPVDFTFLIQDEDQVEVYPAIPVFSGHQSNPKSDALDGQPRFLLDNHLGKLATYLRMLVFDTLYQNDYQDQELAEIASRETRILLTRDRGLLMRRTITCGYCLRTMNPKQQVVDVIKRFVLFEKIQPFRRCLRCNCPLQAVDKQSVLDKLEPLTRQHYNEFCLCPDCNRVYWKGSHYERMEGFFEIILGSKGSNGI